MRCPHCASPDIADIPGGGRVCLDCETYWSNNHNHLHSKEN